VLHLGKKVALLDWYFAVSDAQILAVITAFSPPHTRPLGIRDCNDRPTFSGMSLLFHKFCRRRIYHCHFSVSA
jgi:hypothetical protein